MIPKPIKFNLFYAGLYWENKLKYFEIVFS